jgi:hypothetical protein
VQNASNSGAETRFVTGPPGLNVGHAFNHRHSSSGPWLTRPGRKQAYVELLKTWFLHSAVGPRPYACGLPVAGTIFHGENFYFTTDVETDECARSPVWLSLSWP